MAVPPSEPTPRPDSDAEPPRVVRVVFERRAGEVVVLAAPGRSLMVLAKQAELPLASSCQGEGACKACVVQIRDGANHLSPVQARERLALERAQRGPDERLACQALVLGDVRATTSYW
jgi:ferredoxin, 2Fe-2S